MNYAARGLATNSNSKTEAEAAGGGKPKPGYKDLGEQGPNAEQNLPWWGYPSLGGLRKGACLGLSQQLV